MDTKEFREIFGGMGVRIEELDPFVYFHLNDPLDRTVVYERSSEKLFYVSYLNSEEMRANPGDKEANVRGSSVEDIIEFMVEVLDSELKWFEELSNILFKGLHKNDNPVVLANFENVLWLSEKIMKLKALQRGRLCEVY